MKGYRITLRGKIVLAVLCIFVSVGLTYGIYLISGNVQVQAKGTEDGSAIETGKPREEINPNITTVPSAQVEEHNKDSELLKDVRVTIYYTPDSTVIQYQFYDILDMFTRLAKSSEDYTVQIEGYSASLDTTPETQEYYMELSQERAENVAKYIINKGVDNKKVKIIANGTKDPVKSNDTPENRKYNRRVVISFKENTNESQ